MKTWRGDPQVADGAWMLANEPCRAACPVGTDAGAYVTAIAAGDFASAYAAARANNPFPSVCGRVCAAPCETACRRGVLDAPVAIRALKRHATAHFGVESVHGAAAWHAAHGVVPPATRPPVAIVGAGPAGLAAAYELRLAGHAVVVHEASDRAGGMMALGIPAFRLPRALLEAEIAAILALGVELRLRSRIGETVSLESLLETHAAVFIATGCGRGRELDVPGRELAGVHVAVEYLLQVNRGERLPVAERVVVVGGGSVAFDAARVARRAGHPGEAGLHTSLDAARTARRAGSREVTIVALEAPQELSADEAELAAAAAEGITVRFRTMVTAIEGGGKVEGVRLAAVAHKYDAAGQFAPQLVEPRADERLDADQVIVAVGQRAESTFVSSVLLPERTHFGGLVVDPATGRTGHARLWAGGDIARGPRLLIEAVADGQRAAASIMRALGTAPPPSTLVAALSPVRADRRWSTGYDRLTRQPVGVAPREGALDLIAEAEPGWTDADARREGSRCLRCFEQVTLDPSRCVLCGLCADVCPVGSIALRPDVHTGRWLLALDETACLRCGLCVERCPGQALELVHAAMACALDTAGEAA